METNIEINTKNETVINVATEIDTINIQMKYSNNDIYDLIIDKNTTIMDIVKKAYLNKNKSLLPGVEYHHIPDRNMHKLKIVYRGKLLKIDNSKVVEILNVDSNNIFHCVFTKPTDEDILNIKNNVCTSDELIDSLVTSENFLSFIRVPSNYKKILKIIKHGFGNHINSKDKTKIEENTETEMNDQIKTKAKKPVKKVVKNKICLENTEVQIVEKILDESDSEDYSESDVEVVEAPIKKKANKVSKSNDIDVETTYSGVINELNLMGFSFNDNIKKLLIRHNGDIQLVLNTLLS
jgi:hypothetical protein